MSESKDKPKKISISPGVMPLPAGVNLSGGLSAGIPIHPGFPIHGLGDSPILSDIYVTQGRELILQPASSGFSLDLQEDIAKIRKKLRTGAEALANETKKKEELESEITELRRTAKQLQTKEKLAFLLGSVTSRSHEELFSNGDLCKEFFDDNEKQAFVVSVDIRRSTELMLKARSPAAFSDFITHLCENLVSIFKDNFGVVDKFTGDGILAFFPEFYSGEDAGYFALRACSQAIEAFDESYQNSRSSFTTVLKDVGIGIGIDYGAVHILQMAGSLTVVGQPVVYGCRLGSAPAGRIYYNQPAYEKIAEDYAHVTTIEEADLDLKHEGVVVCYDVKLTSDSYVPALPTWLSDSEADDENANAVDSAD